MKKKNSLLFVFSFLLYSSLHAQTYNILDFGARPDTGRLNTLPIQAAIDKCYSNGGGEVLIPAGKFVSGTIFLKSNVYLHLAPGALLQGSYNPADYPEYDIEAAQKFGTITHNGLYVKYMKALIIADKASNIGITGTGIVRGPGDGQAFQLGLNKDGKPKNLFFIGCTQVLLRDVNILNAAQVTISISGCRRVRLDGIFVQSLTNWNCDGIDIDAQDVTVSDCVIDSEDDALCFKSEYLGKFCENITVTGCVISSICNGIKLGTGSRTGFRNVSISDCVIKKGSFNGYRHFVMKPEIVSQPDSNSVNSGIAIETVDGGVMENINISDIIMTDVLSAIFIRTGRRFVNPDNKPSAMRRVRIQNVIADTRSILPSIMIAGLVDSPIEDVRISNVRITSPGGVNEAFYKTFPATFPENEKSYPENRMFGEKLPGSLFFIRHAKGLELDNVTQTFNGADVRHPVYLEDVNGVSFKTVTIGNKKLLNTGAVVLQKKASRIRVVD